MRRRFHRRELLRNSTYAGLGFWLVGNGALADAKSPNEKLNVGVVGCANRGGANLAGVSGENIVALCDVDERQAGRAFAAHPKARKFQDYRKMLDAVGGQIDAVVVSTPDHTHAPPAVAAMKSGKHCYCEKPLAHSVFEVRAMRDVAREKKLATQMGTQIHAEDNYRRVVELVQAGAIGPIAEVHVWFGGGYPGKDRPKETPPVPAGLDWDLWLGPAPQRPYHPCYLPGTWRYWWDFGCGALGDFGCHYMDLPFWALGLREPTRVEAEGPPVHPEGTPGWLTVRYEFPARGSMPAVRMTWYDGGRRLPAALEPKVPKWGSAVLFVGEKGMLMSDYGRHQHLPEAEFAGFRPPQPTIPKSIGHHREWIVACKTGSPTTCNFDYSGALAEAVLLGNVAYRSGKKLAWDAANLKATGCPEADPYLRPAYRQGWTL